MKQNKTTKVIALLMSMVMITSVFVGNTLSRYVTSVSSTDSARVAVWGINAGEDTVMNLFSTEYLVGDKKVIASNNNGDDTFDKVMAPGAKGEAPFSIINFEQDVAPEVAYEVKISLDDSAIDEKILNNPSVQWKLDDGAYGTWDELKTAILSLSGNAAGRHVYAPGQFATAFKGTQEHKISWQWLLDNDKTITVDGNNMSSNEYDTYMGNLALTNDLNAVIKVSITAQQTDDLVTNENMLDGMNQVINVDDIQPAVFRSAAPMSELQEVKVDGTTVNPSNYDVDEGSTIITLNKDFLETLNSGSHTIDIVSTSVTASTRFFIEEAPIVHGNVIPEGGVYYRGVPETREECLEWADGELWCDTVTNLYIGNYEGYTAKYEAGDKFPDDVQYGDIYVYRDYEYRFNYNYSEELEWCGNYNLDGWGVRYIGDSSEPGEILTSINGKNIVSLRYTFMEKSLVKSPEIPETIVDMTGSFMNCENLIEAPVIPSSVTNMDYAFYNCINLVGTIEINSVSPGGTMALWNTQITWISGFIPDLIKKTIAEDSGITLINPNIKVIDGGDISKTGIYYVGVKEHYMPNWDKGEYSASATAKYINGAMPDTVNTGDIYIDGDYQYRYNMTGNWDIDETMNGWSVKFTGGDYGNNILSSINNKNVVSMESAFAEHYIITEAPEIPDTIINMNSAFAGTNIVTAPVIPASVKYMDSVFKWCEFLGGTVEINANPISYQNIFTGTFEPIVLTGSSTMLNEIAASYDNVTVASN